MTIIRNSDRQVVHRFENGYGASVINDGYGRESGRFEVGVLIFDRNGRYGLTYDTPITDDVLGHLTLDEVDATLAAIAKLTRPRESANAKRREIAKLRETIDSLTADMLALEAELDQ